jgi:hypothetical protein
MSKPENKPLTSLKDRNWVAIHKAIHASQDIAILETESGSRISYKVRVSKNGCRYIKASDLTFMEQNKSKKSEFGSRAKRGEELTWVIRESGSWGLIANDNIERK